MWRVQKNTRTTRKLNTKSMLRDLIFLPVKKFKDIALKSITSLLIRLNQ